MSGPGKKTVAVVSRQAGAQIIRLEEAKMRLARVVKVDEAKKIRDVAEAIRHYAKEQNLGLIVQNQAAEVKIRAERRAGELLAKIERTKPSARPPKSHSRQADGNKSSYRETIKAAGITEPRARRWQKMAAIPAPMFEAHVVATTEAREELTSTGTLALAREMSGPSPIKKTSLNALGRVLHWLQNAAIVLSKSGPIEEPVLKKDCKELIGRVRKELASLEERL